MNILIPLVITDAMLVSSSVAEPAAGETAWVSAGTYVIGDLRIRTTTHRVYQCIQAHTGRTALPENDPLYWDDSDPTQKWAPFDTETSTEVTGTSPMTYVLSPGFFDGARLYKLTGSSLNLTVKDGPGGAVLETRTISLYEEALGLYEYLFSPARPKGKIIADGLPIHPTAEITFTITGPSTVGVGMIAVGQARQIINPSTWGGTEYGASVEPVTYSRIKTDDFGKTTIKRGNAATGMRATVVLPIADANFALQSIQQVLDQPVSIVMSQMPNYAGLNFFGLVNATLTYKTPVSVELAINGKGMI